MAQWKVEHHQGAMFLTSMTYGRKRVTSNMFTSPLFWAPLVHFFLGIYEFSLFPMVTHCRLVSSLHPKKSSGIPKICNCKDNLTEVPNLTHLPKLPFFFKKHLMLWDEKKKPNLSQDASRLEDSDNSVAGLFASQRNAIKIIS